MNCRKCKAEIPDGSLFCNMCGVRQSDPQEKKRKRSRANGMGSIYKAGKYWRAEITTGFINGRQVRKRKDGFKTRREATEYIETLKMAAEEHAQKPRTLQYYYDSWCKTDLQQLSKSKQTAYKIAWKRMEDIQHQQVRKLTIVQLRDLVADEAQTYYPARDMKSLLSHLLKLAIADQQITVNMSQYITLPKLEETEQTPWSPEDQQVIWRAFSDEDVVASYLLLMIYTGMMPGEVCQCTRSMVHLDDRQIVGAGLKTGIRKSTPIVIPEHIVPVIERILTYTDDDPDRSILWTDRCSFYDAYHEFTKNYGLPDLPMYSCRHTTGTALALADVQPSIIQKAMRHARYTTTQKYIHPDISDTQAALNRLK